MLKHVQISPMRNRSDSVSLRSSISCSSSLCGSPEPLGDHHSLRTTSRASSYSSLNEAIPQTTIKIFTSCLKIDIEYKTLGIQWETTSREVVRQVLRRCKMRHRDPRLFYLSMEVTIRKAGVKTVLKLDEEARPAILQACHPKGDSRFCLQMKPGGLIRVHTSALQPTSQYKSLVISEETTSDELLGLLLSTYNSIEPIEQFSIYEVCPGQEYQRKLHPDDLPLRAQQQRTQKGETCHFLVRRNPNYPRRKQLLPPITETSASTTSIASEAGICHRPNLESTTINDHSGDHPSTAEKQRFFAEICNKCKNSFKSCDFCQSNAFKSERSARKFVINEMEPLSYNPVYNIREIRTVCHSFSSLGIDKKLLDIQISSHKKQSKATTTATVKPNFANSNHINKSNKIVKEQVNANPPKGFGNFVYI